MSFVGKNGIVEESPHSEGLKKVNLIGRGVWKDLLGRRSFANKL